MNSTHLPHIVLVGTGGTIASTSADPTQLCDYAVTEAVAALLSAVPAVTAVASISSEQIFNVDSRELSNAMLLTLAQRINELTADPAVDAVVITHGTDSLEETAYFLNLTVKSSKPVVVVGAMRPATALSADGPLNLYNAILLAAQAEAFGLGVMVLMNDRVHAARGVTKAGTTQVDAFSSPGQGCLGEVTNGQVHLFQAPLRAHTLHSEFDITDLPALPAVDVLYDHQNAGLHLYEASLRAGVDGIVVAAMGNGSLSPQAQKGLALAAEVGVACVRSSRTGAGVVTPNADDAQRGLVSSNSLNPQKSRILLMLALTLGRERSLIQDCFNRY